MSYGFRQEAEFCTGCGACQISCKDKNNLPAGINYREIVTKERGTFPHIKVLNVSVKRDGCDFCIDLLKKGENPACVDACPLHILHFIDNSE